ncbi:hypothetical protein ACS0TY_027444 [Phlomoides rotata]
MREYLNKTNGCCDVLNASGHKITSEDHMLYIISGLGTEYNPFMVLISSKFDPILVSEISSLLLSFEVRLEGVISPSFSMDGSPTTVNLGHQQNIGVRNFNSQSNRGRWGNNNTNNRG